MNIDNPNGPIGLDDSEEEGSGCGPGGAGGKGLVNVELQEQLTRRVKHGQHLEQQVERLLQVAATARQEEQVRGGRGSRTWGGGVKLKTNCNIYSQVGACQGVISVVCANPHNASILENDIFKFRKHTCRMSIVVFQIHESLAGKLLRKIHCL